MKRAPISRIPCSGRGCVECVGWCRPSEGTSAHDIFGSPDDMKFRSCLTLFAEVAGDDLFQPWHWRSTSAASSDAATLDLLDLT